MADIVDLAQEDMEREAPAILAASKKPSGPKPCGACHFCQEAVLPDMPFCDAGCRDDWEREQRALAQRPRD